MKTISIVDPKGEAAKLRNSMAGKLDSMIFEAKSIMESVAKYGDIAISDYTEKFEGVRLTSFKVTEQEIKQAYDEVTEIQIRSIKLMKERLRKSELVLLERVQKIPSVISDGVSIKRTVQPISSVGCYIPGGKARYPSTLVMCAVPAKVAGVARIVSVSPPKKDGTIDPLTLVTSDICGVDEFYKIGGAQAIAAMAYGTQTIMPVCKIVGPGGMFVTAGKILASSRVSTDMVAGPTELLVYADSKADPRLIALDLISQSEHSDDTICGLVTTSEKLASEVKCEINNFTVSISRSSIVKASLQKNGFIALCDTEKSGIEFINEFAPEHLQIVSKRADAISKMINSAGLMLLGKYTASSASDYCLGTNHVLPTLTFGRSRGSLSVLDFLKTVSTVRATALGLKKVQLAIKEIAGAEGLLNHYEAVRARLERE